MQDGSRPVPPQVTVDEVVDRVQRLVDRLLDERRRYLLGVAGPPGAGKSTLSAAVVDALPAGVAVVLPMDGYHLAQAELERLGRADRKGAPDTFDAAGFVDLLRRVRAPGPAGAPAGAAEPENAAEPDSTAGVVWAPLFRRDLEEPVANAVPIAATVPLVVVEGNYLLLQDGAWAGVRPLLDECWYALVPDDVRVARLVARHIAHGRSPQAAAEWVHRSDETNARLVARTAHRADLHVRIL